MTHTFFEVVQWTRIRRVLPIATIAALMLFGVADGLAHCDTMNGPVVKAAKAALDRGDIRLALVWVKPEGEAEVRAVFDKVMSVRARGDESRALADRYFFETLVRVHRAGEGAPYMGLKEAGEPLEPGIAAAEHALDEGSPEALLADLRTRLHKGIDESFHGVQAARDYAPQDVQSGRKYVDAYVRYIHYVERLYTSLGSGMGAHTDGPEAHQH